MKLKWPLYLFYSSDLQTASYRINLEKITAEQFNPVSQSQKNIQPSIIAIDPKAISIPRMKKDLLGE